MFKSPLVLPLTLIFAGVLAFMATTDLLPPQVLSFWPIIFVVLGLIGLVSLSTEEILGNESKPAARKSAAAAPKKAASTASKKKTKKTSRKK